jgi:hypothetical protein
MTEQRDRSFFMEPVFQVPAQLDNAVLNIRCRL